MSSPSSLSLAEELHHTLDWMPASLTFHMLLRFHLLLLVPTPLHSWTEPASTQAINKYGLFIRTNCSALLSASPVRAVIIQRFYRLTKEQRKGESNIWPRSQNQPIHVCYLGHEQGRGARERRRSAPGHLAGGSSHPLSQLGQAVHRRLQPSLSSEAEGSLLLISVQVCPPSH